jgi:hypothetical protein
MFLFDGSAVLLRALFQFRHDRGLDFSDRQFGQRVSPLFPSLRY